MTSSIVNANALHIPLASECVQCVVTSPPYYGLRDYGVAGQIGLEQTPAEYVENIVNVFREVWRVLRADGTLWLNLGDSYMATGGSCWPAQTNTGIGDDALPRQRVNNRPGNGIKPKDLIGIPWRVAFALQADGWYLRSDIIWHKPNPMPESVTDRPTKSHEYMFLLAKSERYYYDAEAIKEPHSEESLRKNPTHNAVHIGNSAYSATGGSKGGFGFSTAVFGERGRNRRTVWTIATSPYSGAHFATFPPALVEPCILAGSKPGDLVLDPFSGTATVGKVAIQHQRNYVGVELNPEYIKLAKKRTSGVDVMML